MTYKLIIRAVGLAGLQALCLPLSRANGLEIFTTSASFDSAVASGFLPIVDTDFDGLATGPIANGTAVGGGVTLDYTSVSGPSVGMEVTSAFPTTSGSNSLGATGGGDAFVNGDQITLTFAQPEQAVGLFIITAGPNLTGDFTLGVAQGDGTISGDVDPAFASDPDLSPPTSWVYFLGLVETDPSQTFTSATFSSEDIDPAGTFVFNLDDIVTTSSNGTTTGTVPDEASTLGLLVSAGAALGALRRRYS
jgi:hypothetical protein